MCSSGSIGQSLCADPITLVAGATVRITGHAPNCDSVTILSNAFPSAERFAGLNAVSAAAPGGDFATTVTVPGGTPPGGYPVTVRACGGNLGVELTLTVT